MASPNDPGSGSASMPVPADAVRVWRGYRLASVAPEAFFAKLGAIFIPVTVQMQRLFHLSAYLPAVMPAEKAAGMPDEIALVFYATQQAYLDTANCVGGRAYSLLHATLFDLGQSKSAFPIPLPAVPAVETPYHLFADAVDWQGGFTQVFAGSRRAATDPALFAHQIGQWCQALQRNRPGGLDGAIVVFGTDYLLCWEHWLTRAAAQSSTLGQLTEIAATELMSPYSPVAVVPGLDAAWPGLPVAGGECFNTRFPRLGASG